MLNNTWYAVLASAELLNDAPRKVVLGTRIYALYRDSLGAIKALADRCPHEGASLAGGKIKDDCIKCPYHSWHFRGDGTCMVKPADPKAPIRDQDHTQPFAVCEQDGFVWLFNGNIEAVTTLPSRLICEGTDDGRSVNGVFKFSAHIDRVMLNGTDVAHVPFVHPEQFGNAMMPATPRYDLQFYDGGAAAALTSVAPSTLEQILLSKIALNGDMVATATAYFFMPNVTALKVERGGKTVLLLSAHVPIGDEHSNQTETHWLFRRNFLQIGLLDQIFCKSVNKVFETDAVIICDQFPQALTLEILESGANAQPSDRLGMHYRLLLRKALLG